MTAQTPDTSGFTRTVLAALRVPNKDDTEKDDKKEERTAPVTTLLLTARIARAVGNAENAAAMSAPQAITVLVVPRREDRDRLFADGPRIFAGLAGTGGQSEQETTVPVCLTRVSGASRRSARDDEFARSVDTVISTGKPLVLVVSDLADVPDSARSLGYVDYSIDPLNAEDLAAVLAAVFPDNPGISPARFSGMPEALFWLSDAVYEAAFRLDTADAVATRLIECAKRAAAPRPTATLEDLHLAPDLRRALDGLLMDLDDHRAGRVSWQDVPSSLLLHGPPGCGKTSVAHALAGSAGLSLVSATYGECQAAGTLQYYLQTMESRVERAIAGAPSLFFVDELDSFPRRDRDHGRNDSYVTAVVNHLLDVPSRLSRMPGIVVMGATNYRDRVDPAIVRAGRFDTHVHVGPPDRAGVAAILRRTLGPAYEAVDLTGIARDLMGQTGAEIAALARKAQATARRARRDVTEDDLAIASRDHARRLDPDTLHRVAIHEAGHAVVQTALSRLPAPERAVLSGLDAHVESASLPLLTFETAEDILVLRLAGRAAERALLGAVTSGSGSDLRQATALAMDMETRFGLTDETLAYRPYLPDCPWHWPAELSRAVVGRLAAADARAVEIVSRHTQTILIVADALAAERDLDRARLDELLAPVRGAPASRQSNDLPAVSTPPQA